MRRRPRARAQATLAASIAACLLGTGRPVGAQAVSLTPSEMPICQEGTAPYSTWRNARGRATGMGASSVDRFLVPGALAGDDCDGAIDLSLNQSGRFDDGFHAWIAAARCKEAVCGTAHSLEPFCGGVFATGECDLNNNIFVADDASPAERVTALLERHRCLVDTVGLPADLAFEGGTLCFNKPSRESTKGWLLHAEGTAPYGRARDAMKAAWATQAEYEVWRNSLAAGQQMCVYGPVVGDTGHGLKAEVHPVNMYWWTRSRPTSAFAPGGPYDLLMVQDASGRYGNEFGYVIREPFPENRVWRPWSQAPLVGQFEIPVFLRDQDVLAGSCASETRQATAPGADSPRPVPAFRIQPWQACQGAPTITDEIQPAPPPQCVSQREPRLHVEVAAKNTAYEKFDVNADWACRCNDGFCGGPGYLGYLRLDARVGLDRDFWEGALGLTVVDTRLQPAVLPPPCVDRTVSAASRVAAESRPQVPTIEGRVRRVLTKRSGREQEDLVTVPRDPALGLLLAEIGWPKTDDLPWPPVEQIRRPKEIELEVMTRIIGLDEESVQDLEIAKTWRVEVAPLPLTPDSWTTVIDGKRIDHVKVRTPGLDRPYKVRATVGLVAGDSRVATPDAIRQHLWTDRLSLKASEMEGWIEKMSHICDRSVAARAASGQAEAPAQMTAVLRNLLSEAGRRGEVTMTTLAILAYLENENCPDPGPAQARKWMMR